MVKNLIIALLVSLFFIIAPVGVYFLSYSQTTNNDDQKVKYNLPYPGVLPDNPLFFFKSSRDMVLEIMTRDNVKKANLYLLLSDKQASMALSLEKKGREKLAVQTMAKAEASFLKLVKALQLAKKQGSPSEGAFIQTVKLSNDKHREVIEILRKELPQDNSLDAVQEILKTNEKVKKELSTL